MADAQVDSVFYCHLSVGVELPMSNLDQGVQTDLLVGTNRTPLPVVQLGGALMLSPRIGLELAGRLTPGNGGQSRFRRFDEEMSISLAQDYFLLNSELIYRGADEPELTTEAWIGLCYRSHHGSSDFSLGFQYGFRSIDVYSAQYELKEIDGNQVYDLSYTGRGRANSMPTLGLSTVYEYPMSNRLMLRIQGRYAMSWADFDIERSFYNRFTRERTQTLTSYQDQISTLSFGLGLTVLLDNPL